MRTLTAAMEAQRTATATSPRILVRIDISGDGDYSGMYSDQDMDVSGNTYEGYVQEISDINSSLDLVKLGSTDDIEIIMKNDDTEKFATIAITNQLEGKAVWVELWFPGTTYSTDAITLFRGHIESIREHANGGTALHCVEFGKKYLQELPLREINEDDFDWDLPPENLGAKIPVIYGKLENAKGLCIWGYPTTKLYTAHRAEQTVILCDDVSNFPSSGTVLIGMEEISYGDIDVEYDFEGQTIGALLDCTRGAGGTTALPHKEGSVVAIAKQHIYIFADHGCGAIRAPLINGIRPIDDYTSNDASTSFARLRDGETQRTCILTFDESPARYLEIQEGVESMNVYPNVVDAVNSATDPTNAIDQIEGDSYAQVSAAATPLAVKQTLDLSDYEYERGPIKQAFVTVEYEYDGTFSVGDFTVDVA